MYAIEPGTERIRLHPAVVRHQMPCIPAPIARANASDPSMKKYLDIYSPEPGPRLVVLAMMALGVVLLSSGVSTGSAAGAIPFLVLVWANARRFLGTVEALLTEREWLIIALPLMVFASRLLMAPPTAIDDLLRHIASAFWPGGYADMYIYSDLPAVELYPFFDTAVGVLAKAIGPTFTMWVAQAVALGGFVAVFVSVALRQVQGGQMAGAMILISLALVMSIMSMRLFLGRPEVFLTIWAIAAPLAAGRARLAIWLMGGVVLSGAYWLAPVYFTAALLLPYSRRARIAAFAGLAGVWLALWFWMAGAEFLSGFAHMLAQVGNRIDGIVVSENVSILNLLISPPMLVLLIGSFWAVGRSKPDNRFLILAVFFMLANQTRYGGVIAPLLAFHLLPALRGWAIPWPRYARISALLIGTFWLSSIADNSPKYGQQPRFTLPQDSVVLSYLSSGIYFVPFSNPGAVKVAPGPEIGAASPVVQALSRDLTAGHLNCDDLAGLGFTHLVEDTLRGTPPSCLKLGATHLGWRLWEIELPD